MSDKKNLIIICRDKKQQEDFFEVCNKIVTLVEHIDVYCLLYDSNVRFDSEIWKKPSLTVSMNSEFILQIERGPTLKPNMLEKIQQYKIFRENDIPTPYIHPFKFGAFLDPFLFGEYVVVKPANILQSSVGNYLKVFRRSSLQKKTSFDFPNNHMLNTSDYLVQKFIDTGINPVYYRVFTFMGKCVNAWQTKSIVNEIRIENSSDEMLEKKIIDPHEKSISKERNFIFDEKIISLGEKVHTLFPDIPTLGVDIICDINTGNPFVLECNPGGNTWHFSSKLAERFRKGFGNAEINGPEKADKIARELFIKQFDAFDLIAKRLIEATNDLAS